MKRTLFNFRSGLTACFSIAIFLSRAAPVAADSGPNHIHPQELEAVYLINFCRFASWGDQFFSDATAPIVIGIWGDRSFADTVQIFASGEKVGARAIEVRRIDSDTPPGRVQLLYVPSTNERRFDQWQRDGLKGMLVVGDSANILHAGGHIQFVREGHRIRLRINPGAIKDSELSVSSSLLRLAEIVPSP